MHPNVPCTVFFPCCKLIFFLLSSLMVKTDDAQSFNMAKKATLRLCWHLKTCEEMACLTFKNTNQMDLLISSVACPHTSLDWEQVCHASFQTEHKTYPLLHNTLNCEQMKCGVRKRAGCGRKGWGEKGREVGDFVVNSLIQWSCIGRKCEDKAAWWFYLYKNLYLYNRDPEQQYNNRNWACVQNKYCRKFRSNFEIH